MRPAVRLLLLALPLGSESLRHDLWQAPDLDAVYFGNTSALIFSTGKVASTTIWVTVSMLAGYYQYADKFQVTYKPILKTHADKIAADFVRKDASEGPIWVFTSVRQPFTRLISMYFEDVEMERYSSQNRTLAMSMPEMREDFLAWYSGGSHGHRQESWFHTSLLEVTGANLTDYAFPVEDGKLVVESSAHGRRFIIVLLRYEDILRWTEIMRPTVPWWGVADVHKQNAKELWYGEKYRQFAMHFKWPKEEAKALLDCDNLRFYSAQEREAFYRHAVGEDPPPRALGDGTLQLLAGGRPKALRAFGGGDA
mmetsp:Transcript_92621/g.246042  ORF Transcript_92621/g.246042 Transcript_92621/m.246042 type:complete len:310 (-) Transcript_92621:106-1035(-)